MSSKSKKSFTDPERTRPIGMLRYAIEFYATALAADDAIGDPTLFSGPTRKRDKAPA
jgi:hypothetical protein